MFSLQVFQCNHCEATYTDASNLSRHKKRVSIICCGLSVLLVNSSFSKNIACDSANVLIMLSRMPDYFVEGLNNSFTEILSQMQSNTTRNLSFITILKNGVLNTISGNPDINPFPRFTRTRPTPATSAIISRTPRSISREGYIYLVKQI